MKTQAGVRFTGASVKRSEDVRILTGAGTYIDDIKMPGMVHAAFLRSPMAHARITSIDASAAREAPGVLAVFTGEEMREHVTPGGYSLQGMFGIPGPEYSALCIDKVRLVGDVVAMVVAESRHLAEDALDLIEVDYDDLTPILTIDDALDPSNPPLFEDLGSNVVLPPTTKVSGDVDAAFQQADRVLKARITQHRYQNVPMECRGIVASYDANEEQFLIWSANQGIQPTRMSFAARLGVPIEKVHLRTGDIGGSFGLKIGAAREDICVAVAAKVVGRPVKWFEDRFEHMCAAGHARDERVDIEVAYTDEGDILGLKVDLVVDTGSYPGLGPMITGQIADMLPSAYKIRAVAATTSAVATNKAMYVAYRGPWAVETFVRERVIDLVAHELGKEPIEIRLRNVVAPGEQPATMITSGLSLEHVTMKESMERMGSIIDVPEFRRRQEQARKEGRYLGLGIASFIEPAPGVRSSPEQSLGTLGNEPMRMVLQDDGRLVVYTAQMPHGQSHETTIAQIAADEFGVPFDDVTVVVGDSDLVPYGMTGGSKAATMSGGASLVTARSLRAKVTEAAAHLLEANADDIEIRDGAVGVRGDQASAMPLSALVAAVREPGRLPEGVDTSFDVTEEYDGGSGGWSGGTHAAIVEVDINTGLVSFDRYVVVEDCGELINPAVVDGQVRGGVAQGIGAVLLERSAYDEYGQFLAATFMDYLLPTTMDIPNIEIVHMESPPVDPDVNFRGVGEGGLIVSTATVVNAIEDALSPFGVRIYEEHLPPARILELAGVVPAA